VLQGPSFVQILDASFNELGDSCLPVLENLQSLRVSHRGIYDGFSQSMTFVHHLEGSFEGSNLGLLETLLARRNNVNEQGLTIQRVRL
jgi:hypothetical protein